MPFLDLRYGDVIPQAQSYEHAQKGDHMMRAARAGVEATCHGLHVTDPVYGWSGVHGGPKRCEVSLINRRYPGLSCLIFIKAYRQLGDKRGEAKAWT